MTISRSHSHSARFEAWQRRAAVLTFAVACLLTFLIYYPGLNGPFLFDDNLHIVGNERLQISDFSPDSISAAFSSSQFNFPDSRPLTMLSYGLQHAIDGSLDPYRMKLGSLLLHILTGVVVFYFLLQSISLHNMISARKIEETSWVPALTGSLWLLAPINLTPVLYLSQRSTILSTLFVFVALAFYVSGRKRMLVSDNIPYLHIILVLVAACCAALSKINALLLVVFIPLLEFTLFKTRTRTRVQRIVLLALLAPLLVLIVYAVAWIPLNASHFTELYAGRPFTLEQRLLTEARVLMLYLDMIFLPDINDMTLFHDGLALSTSVLQPINTLFSLIALAGLSVAGAILLKYSRLAAFGILFFLAGHLLESTVIALEPMFEHRNYTPSVGIIFAAITLLAQLYSHYNRWIKYGVIAVVSLFFTLSATATAMRSEIWQDRNALTAHQFLNHPASIRATLNYSRLLGSRVTPENQETAPYYHEARSLLRSASARNPESSDLLLDMLFLDLQAGNAFDPEIARRLVQNLERYPMTTSRIAIPKLISLLKWKLYAPKAIPDRFVEKVYTAAFANKQLSGSGRASLHISYARFLFATGQPITAVRKHSRQARRYWPGNPRVQQVSAFFDAVDDITYANEPQTYLANPEFQTYIKIK